MKGFDTCQSIKLCFMSLCLLIIFSFCECMKFIFWLNPLDKGMKVQDVINILVFRLNMQDKFIYFSFIYFVSFLQFFKC